MFGHMHRHDGHRGGRGCGPRGGPGGWERFAEEFAGRWQDAQRGGGGRRRMFDGGELRLVLLRLIADAPRHGYELIKAIEELTGGAYAPSPGMVYPALTMLAEMELVAEQQSDTTRKRFAVTTAGESHLAENATLVEALMARLAEVGAHRARNDRAPIRRAMRNLRTGLQNRLETDDLSDEAAHEIAALIDATVQQIERVK